MRVILVVSAFLVSVASVGNARADWLDDAWSSKTTAKHGTPAITVRPDGVTVVLPRETLEKALAEPGTTQADALRAFLGRYSPKCSHVLDLNTARSNLTVDLQILAATPFDKAPAETADEVMAAMESVEIPATKHEPTRSKDRRLRVPRVTQLFTTMPEHWHFSIDYTPDKVAHCVAPEDPIS